MGFNDEDLPEDMPDFIKKLLGKLKDQVHDQRDLSRAERHQYIKDIEEVINEYYIVAMSFFKKSIKDHPEQFERIPTNQNIKETAYCVANSIIKDVNEHIHAKLKIQAMDRIVGSEQEESQNLLKKLQTRIKDNSGENND